MTTIDTPPAPAARGRMTRTCALYQNLLTAAGVAPADQVIDLTFLQALHDAPAATRAALDELLSAHAQITAHMLTVEQVAARLRVKPKHVRKLARWGALQGYQGRGGWRFTELQLADFIERQAFLGGLCAAELESRGAE